MNISYRLANLEDWPDLAAFRNKYSKEGIEKASASFLNDFDAKKDNKRSALFVAKTENKIVGYGHCGFFDPAEGKSLYDLQNELPQGYYLKDVLTDESVRGQGVGKQLTILRNQWVQNKSDRGYCVLQNTNIPSLKMHQALGYQIIKDGLCYQGVQNDCSGLLLEFVF